MTTRVLIRVVAALWLLGVVALASGQSQDGLVLGRYSVARTLLITAWTLAALLGIEAPASGARQPARSLRSKVGLVGAVSALMWAPFLLAEQSLAPDTPAFAGNEFAVRLGLAALAVFFILLVWTTAVGMLRTDSEDLGDRAVFQAACAAVAYIGISSFAPLPAWPWGTPIPILLGTTVAIVSGRAFRLASQLNPRLGYYGALAALVAWGCLGAIKLPAGSPGVAGGYAVLCCLWLLRGFWVRRWSVRGMVLHWAGFIMAWAVAVVAFTTPEHEVSRADSVRGEAGPDRPDILLVVVDTLRADHLQLHGYGRSTTPWLAAAVGREAATVFRSAFTAATATRASVKALFTGLPASTWGLSQKAAGEPPDEAVTIAEVLRGAGYETCFITTNAVLQGQGYTQGFDTRWTIGGLNVMNESTLVGNFVAPGRNRLDRISAAGALRLDKPRGLIAVDAALAWLASKQDRPTFTYLHLIEPHWPYHAHGYGFAAGDENPWTMSQPPWRTLLGASPGSLWEWRGSAGERALVARYDEEVREADYLLSRLADGLVELGRWSSTLTIVTSDHGEEFFERGGFSHGHDVFPEQSHVPLVLFWPTDGWIPDQLGDVFEPVSLIDLLPTLTDFLGVSPPSNLNLPGMSLINLIHGETRREPVFVEAADSTWLGAYVEGDRFVRVEMDASLQDSSVRVSSYRLGDGSLVPPDVASAANLRRYVDAIKMRAGQSDTRSSLSGANEEAVDRLRALGYLK